MFVTFSKLNYVHPNVFGIVFILIYRTFLLIVYSWMSDYWKMNHNINIKTRRNKVESFWNLKNPTENNPRLTKTKDVLEKNKIKQKLQKQYNKKLTPPKKQEITRIIEWNKAKNFYCIHKIWDTTKLQGMSPFLTLPK